MNFKIQRFFVLLIVASLLGYSNEIPDEIETLQIEQIYDISLSAQQHHSMSLAIPNSIVEGQNLFISSILSNSLQKPTIKLMKTDGTQIKVCSSDSNDTCSLSSDQLQKGGKLIIQTYCVNDCQVQIVAYLSKTASPSGGSNFYRKINEGQSDYREVGMGESRLYKVSIPDNIKGIELAIISFDVLSGNSLISASLTNNFQNNLPQDSSSMSGNQAIVLDSLQPGKPIYIKIYGRQHSSYILSVLFKRKSINQFDPIHNYSPINISLSPVELNRQVTHRYTLQKGQGSMRFAITHDADHKDGKVKVSQLIGKLNTTMYMQENKDEKVCKNQICEIPDSEETTKWIIQVDGAINQTQQFTILYSANKQCYVFPLGIPLVGEISYNDTECLKVTINDKNKDIEIVNSLNDLQIVNNQFTMSAKLPLSQQYMIFKENVNIITSQQLQEYCQKERGNCEIIVKFESHSQKRLTFHTIVQETSSQMDLYDGLAQSSSCMLSSSSSKNFKYHLHHIQNGMEIFLTSSTQMTYRIEIGLISQQDLDEMNTEKTGVHVKNALWTKMTDIDSWTLTIIKITKDQLQQAMKDFTHSPWIIISVYGGSKEEKQAKFTIEVIQKQRVLREGTSTIGYLQPHEVVTYELYPDQKQSLLSARPLTSVTDNSYPYNFFNPGIPGQSYTKCYVIIDDKGKVLDEGEDMDQYLIQNAPNIPLYYQIQSLSSSSDCMYQISLQHYYNSIITIIQGFSQPFSLKYSQITYFLFYNGRNQSFRVLENLLAGQTKVYATPLHESLAQLGLDNLKDKIRKQDFKYTNYMKNQPKEIHVESNDEGFCSDCYYLIAVEGNPIGKGQLIVVSDSTPILLTQGISFYDNLSQNEEQIYIYYSQTSDLHLKLHILYGKVNVTVIEYRDEGEHILAQQTVGNDSLTEKFETFTLKSKQKNKPVDGVEHVTKYKIKIHSVSQDTEYSVEMTGNKNHIKINEGQKREIQIEKKGTGEVQVENIRSHNDADILLTFENSQIAQSASIKVVQYNFTHGYIKRNPLKQRTQYTSEKFNDRVKLKIFKGISRFSILIQNNYAPGVLAVFGPIKVSVFMPLIGVQSLSPHLQLLLDHQSIFKIYVPALYDAVVEVYSCKGSLRVRGSYDYEELEQANIGPKQTQLSHNNIGGHYVIRTQKIEGVYFLRVQSKDYLSHISQNILGCQYVIKYHFVPKGQPDYYDMFDLENNKVEITKKNKDFINFKINPISVIKTINDVEVQSILYKIIIENQDDDSSFNGKCPKARKFKELAFSLQKKSDIRYDQHIRFQVPIAKIVRRVGNSQSVVGASVTITLKDKKSENVTNQVVFVYDPVQLLRLEYKQSLISTLSFFEIVIILIISIKLIAVSYFIFLRVMKQLRGYQQNAANELVQVTEEAINPNQHPTQDNIK